MDAQLNVTYGGMNGDLRDPVDFDMDDASIKRVAEESIRDGYLAGIAADPAVSLADFVVDRFGPTDTLPARIFVRPKTPFGA